MGKLRSRSLFVLYCILLETVPLGGSARTYGFGGLFLHRATFKVGALSDREGSVVDIAHDVRF